MVKISKLKMEQIRKEIPFVNEDGSTDTIKVYNVTPETKEQLKTIVESYTNEDGEINIEGGDMLRDLFPLFTDLEIDLEYIDDVLENPSKEMILINAEILSIINEVGMEVLLAQTLEYEKLLLLSEQIKGMNMVSYIKDKMSRLAPMRDFDPLNSASKEERNRLEMEQIRASYDGVKEIYEQSIREDEARLAGELLSAESEISNEKENKDE